MKERQRKGERRKTEKESGIEIPEKETKTDKRGGGGGGGAKKNEKKKLVRYTERNGER